MKQAGPGGGRTTRNILALSRASSGAREQVTFEESLAAVLEPVLADLGSMDARRDARAATSAVIGVLQDILARKDVVQGQRVSVRVELGGRRIVKQKNHTENTKTSNERDN